MSLHIVTETTAMKTTDSVHKHLWSCLTRLIHIWNESLLPAEDVPAETDPPFHAVYVQSESPR